MTAKHTPRVTVRLSDDEIDILYAALDNYGENFNRSGADWPHDTPQEKVDIKLLRARARVRRKAEGRQP